MHHRHFFAALSIAIAGGSASAQSMQSTQSTHPTHPHDAHADGGIGQPGVAANVTRTVKVDMSDNMRFTPDAIRFKAGDTIRFIVTNSGKIRHEMVFGSDVQLKAHYAAMLKNPEMEHADDNQITLAPGKSGELLWQFSQAGTVNFACLQPGHYDAGMKGSVTVAGAAHKH